MANQITMNALPNLFEILLVVILLILWDFVVENVITVLAPCKILLCYRHPIVSRPIKVPLKVPILGLSFISSKCHSPTSNP
jgi:hypothetical protein